MTTTSTCGRAILALVGMAAIGATSACASGATPPSRAADAEADALARTTLETLDREACPKLLTRTFPLESDGATTGKLWVRRCATRPRAGALDVDVDVLGWQWIGAGSWGFDVREYVYFRATVRASVRAAIEVDGELPRLRVWSDAAPEITVAEIGRVSARASSPAASLLGVASGIFGQGPNVLATSTFRSRVRDMIEERATRGILVALGDTPPPGGRAPREPTLLDEREALFPGGALISGSFPASVTTNLRYEVIGPGEALARAVCVDEALALVDAVVAGAPRPPSDASPNDLLALAGAGELRVPARACPWVLVTGAKTDAPARLHVTLSAASAPARDAAKRWVRATVLAYALEDEGEVARRARLFALRVGREGATRELGRPLTSARAPSVWLVADPVELAGGAPLVVALAALAPRASPWWSGAIAYDETLLGRALVVPNGARASQRALLERDGRVVGWVEVALDAPEIQ